MVQHAGADDLVEGRFQLARRRSTASWRTCEVVQLVLALQRFGAAHARRAEVDAGDPRLGPAQGVLGRLRRAAAGDEDRVVFAIGPPGQKRW